LDQLDRVAVRIGDPRSAQFVVEKIMGRREERGPVGNQRAHCGIGVVRPKDDLDPAPFALRTQAVVLSCRFDCRNSELKSVQR